MKGGDSAAFFTTCYPVSPRIVIVQAGCPSCRDGLAGQPTPTPGICPGWESPEPKHPPPTASSRRHPWLQSQTVSRAGDGRDLEAAGLAVRAGGPRWAGVLTQAGGRCPELKKKHFD